MNKTLHFTSDILKYSCNANETLSDVLYLFDFTLGRPLIVVDSDGELVGTLSSGDIRRSHQKHEQVKHQKVLDICNKNVIYARTSDSSTTVNRLLDAQTLCVPIIDNNRVVRRIAFLATPSLEIQDCQISSDRNNILLIAEIGVNHNGDFNIAKKLIEAAYASGFDAVKFQYRSEDTYSTDTFESQDLSVQYIKKELSRCSLSTKEYQHLFEYVKELGLLLICTPFDIKSLEYVLRHNLDAIKIASCDLTNKPLIQAASDTGLPLILSTGMSYEYEIIEAASLLSSRPNVAFLHCNSTYPAPIEDLNMSYISRLSKITERPVGYSSHEGGGMAALVAVGCGARIIEVHITLDQGLSGSDHLASLPINKLDSYVKYVRQASHCLGDDLPRVPSQGEIINRSTLGKSLAYAASLKTNHIVQREDLELRSPGTGFQLNDIDQILGKKLLCDVEAGNLFKETDVSQESNFNCAAKSILEFTNCNLIPGIPVRYHDFESLNSRFQLPLYEFHLSAHDLTLNPSEYIDSSSLLNKKVVFHAIEQYDDGFIIDLASSSRQTVEESIARIRILLQHLKHFKNTFGITEKIDVVINPGGFSVDGPCVQQEALSKTARVAEAITMLSSAAPEFELLAQTMPPFPWHQGGRSFHNILTTPELVRNYIELSNKSICIDVSHTAMSANHFRFDLHEFMLEFSQYCFHYHLADASKSGQEGLQIDEGELDFKKVLSSIKKNSFTSSFIPEIWQGHLKQGSGFETAFQRITKYL